MRSNVSLALRSRLPLIVLAVVAALALVLPHQVWTALTLGLATLLGIAYAWVRLLAGSVHGQRQVRFRWVAVGDLLEEWFEVVNQSPVPLLWVEVVDESNVPGYQVGIVRSVDGGQRNRWREQAICERRGRFTLGPWSLQFGDPFGLFDVVVRYDESQEIIIHPPIHTQLPVALPAGRRTGGVQRRIRWQQAQLNAAGVREYRPSDPYHHIHWPTSARTGELHVRQFEQDAAGDVWLVLDLDATAQLGEGATSTLEQMVLLAASLTSLGLQQNRAIGLAAYGDAPQLIPPSRGQGHQWRMLRALALISAESHLPLAQSLADLATVVQRGAAVLILTATDSAEWLPQLLQLTQRGVWGDVVLLDRASFGGSDNLRLRRQIQQVGFQCTVIRQGNVGQRVHVPRDEGQWEYRVTPSGRTVAVRRPST